MFAQKVEKILTSADCLKAMTAIATDPGHPQHTAMIRVLSDRAWGKPREHMVHEGSEQQPLRVIFSHE